MSDVHPVQLRASVRGLDHNDPRIIAAALLYDAITDHRRFDAADKVSHVAGCVLDVAERAGADATTHLAGSVWIVGTFPRDVEDDLWRALTAERFNGPVTR